MLTKALLDRNITPDHQYDWNPKSEENSEIGQ